jgi:LmbE family N-acetylglucosaminyl deacetylase
MSDQLRLMCILAHPDDESLGFGGILARYAAEGVHTVLVTCTGGEVGEISDPSLASPANLAEVRARELDASVRILGISRSVRLGYRDSGMAGTPDNDHPASLARADVSAVVGRVRRVIEEERPQVVVTYDERGGYGHPDHIRAHQVAVAAAVEVPKLYYSVFPRSAARQFLERVRAAGIEGPACAANDINLAALAEHRHGAGRGARDLLCVATGHRGVGGALVLDGRLHTGSSGLALEVGHLTVNPAGRPCHCGSRGCLDVEADPLALLTAAGRDPGPADSPLKQADDLVRDHYADPTVRTAAETLIDRLGLGLAGLVNILNPDRIILGGLHRTLLDADPDRLRAVVADRSLWGQSGSVPILPCTLDHNSLVGAAELAWQPVLDDPLAALGA